MTRAASSLVCEDLSVSLSDRDRRFRLSTGRIVLRSGEIIGLSGGSGTGKTLLLEVLGLLRQPDPGGTFTLRSDAEQVDLCPPPRKARIAELRGRYFGFVPQAGGLLPFLTVSENIALSQRISGRMEPGWAAELIERLGLAGLERQVPSVLSIGQRQRVSIARALAHKPAFVVADEPTAALDPEAALAAMGLLIEAAERGGSGVIISSHDRGLLERFAMRRLHLSLARHTRAGEVHSVLAPVAAEAA